MKLKEVKKGLSKIWIARDEHRFALNGDCCITTYDECPFKFESTKHGMRSYLSKPIPINQFTFIHYQQVRDIFGIEIEAGTQVCIDREKLKSLVEKINGKTRVGPVLSEDSNVGG